MKKNKTIAYALAATLLVGGTFAGTKALFTDSDVIQNDNLTVTTGVVDVDIEEDVWYKNDIPQKQAKFDGVVPGDEFKNTAKIMNNSNIPVDATTGFEFDGDLTEDEQKLLVAARKDGFIELKETIKIGEKVYYQMEDAMEDFAKGDEMEVITTIEFGSGDNTTDNKYQGKDFRFLTGGYKIELTQKTNK